ncbi:MAG TPA: histidine kinase [Clostridiales bacterium]|nr:histidine kinase [Clostridiales bacterium]
MIRKRIENLVFMNLRTKLLIILVVFAIAPSFFLYHQVMTRYKSDMVDVASQSVHSIVKSNNNLIDTTLSRIEDISYLLLNNKESYDLFSNMDQFSVSDFLKQDRLITAVLGKQFLTNEAVYERYLYTSKWIFGDSNRLIMNATIEEIQSFKLNEMAAEAGGQAYWITGYDYGQWFQTEYLKNRETYEYQYPITMIREMNFQYMYNGHLSVMPSDQERPILVVHVLEQTLASLYESSVSYDGSIYAIVNEAGKVISSDNGMFPITERIPEDIQLLSKASGYTSYRHEDIEYLLCYDAIEERGWFSFSLIPMEGLVKQTEDKIQRLQRWLNVILIIAAVLVSVLLSSSISKPIAVLIKAAKRISTGDFSANTPLPKGKDFKLLTESFNHMEMEITRLIEENYKISLREKDTQIMALTLQINPHFLYNTLNTINMLAIQNGDDETSDLIVSLSEMLHYSFKDTREKIPLSDELQWTINYINIMFKRFEGVFQTQIEVHDDLMIYKVPKFFLQPIVENAILHGFEGMSSGGNLLISAEKQEDCLVFIVSDNGKGMADKNYEMDLQKDQVDSIGLANVYRRLSLIYGDDFNVNIQSELGMGTIFTLSIPCEK